MKGGEEFADRDGRHVGFRMVSHNTMVPAVMIQLFHGLE